MHFSWIGRTPGVLCFVLRCLFASLCCPVGPKLLSSSDSPASAKGTSHHSKLWMGFPLGFLLGCFWDKDSMCSTGWTQTWDSLASASQMQSAHSVHHRVLLALLFFVIVLFTCAVWLSSPIFHNFWIIKDLNCIYLFGFGFWVSLFCNGLPMLLAEAGSQLLTPLSLLLWDRPPDLAQIATLSFLLSVPPRTAKSSEV